MGWTDLIFVRNYDNHFALLHQSDQYTRPYRLKQYTFSAKLFQRGSRIIIIIIYYTNMSAKDNAKHTLFECRRWLVKRQKLDIAPETIIMTILMADHLIHVSA